LGGVALIHPRRRARRRCRCHVHVHHISVGRLRSRSRVCRCGSCFPALAHSDRRWRHDPPIGVTHLLGHLPPEMTQTCRDGLSAPRARCRVEFKPRTCWGIRRPVARLA
jgi:hypothetical protein